MIVKHHGVRTNMKQISENDVIEALKTSYKTEDVKKADAIFDGENAFIVNDDNFLTIFYNYSDAIKFYRNALSSDDIFTSIDFVDRYVGKNSWKKYIDKNKLRDFIKNAIGNREVGNKIKYVVEHDPVASLKLFFPDNTISNDRLIKTILFKHCSEKMIADAVDTAISKVGTKRIYIPSADDFLFAFEWNKVQDEY